MDVGDVAPPARERLCEAISTRLGDDVVAPLLHGLVLLEVAPDEDAGFFAADALALGQTKVAKAVEHSEVEDLGAVAHGARDLFHWYAEDLRSRCCVDVLVIEEGRIQRRVLR